ncbi:MAG TPA: cobalamin B12-binding domain-containing protein [Candidatus Nitrosotalea sp.]|nr:cobalamin B12-binding domain-containing protein [Candidatus Nitrosotalea sp.]
MVRTSASAPLRIVLAKIGLDGHDRGVKVVARALRDAGFEVIYTGLRQTPGMVVEAALQEDARVIGLSLHSGAHMTLIPAVLDELRRRQMSDVLVFAGGIIPPGDAAELRSLGVAEIFTPGTPLDSIVSWLRERQPALQGGDGGSSS